MAVTRSGISVDEGGRLCYACLGSLFPECVTLKVRQEHLVLAELQRRLPELEEWFLEWDCPVAGGCSLHRPDMLWELPSFYFQIEIDEGGKAHEDDRERLAQIQRSMGGDRTGLVLRINPDGMLAKRQHRDGEVKYTATPQFTDKMDAIEVFIRDTVLAAMGPTGMGCPFGSGTVTVRKLFFSRYS